MYFGSWHPTLLFSIIMMMVLLLDVSVFRVQDSSISIRKVSGLSNCGEDEAVYTFILKDNNLNLYLTKDNCSDRSGALDKAVFTRKD